MAISKVQNGDVLINSRKSQKITERNGLSCKQQKAVAELLKPSSKSYEDVARALGISSRCLYNWRKEPKFQEALRNGVDQLTERVLSAAEFSVQLDSMNSMLDYEAKVLDAIDIREAIIKLMENQERMRIRIEAIMKEVERLKNMVNVISAGI